LPLNLYSQTLPQEKCESKVRIGMTKTEVKSNWGEPDNIICETGKDYDEIWIYIPHWKFKNYLYFKDGILIKGNPNPEDLI
jgi:hypothetical protein